MIRPNFSSLRVAAACLVASLGWSMSWAQAQVPREHSIPSCFEQLR
jgi:hypothetical protein